MHPTASADPLLRCDVRVRGGVPAVLSPGAVRHTTLPFPVATSRYLHAMARERLLPTRLSHTGDARSRSQRGTPVTTSIVQGLVTATLLAGFVAVRGDPVRVVCTWLAALSALTIITSLIMASMVALFWFQRAGGDSRNELRTRWIALSLGIVSEVSGALFTTARMHTLFGPSSASRATVLMLLLIVAAALAGPLSGAPRSPPRDAAPGPTQIEPTNPGTELKTLTCAADRRCVSPGGIPVFALLQELRLWQLLAAASDRTPELEPDLPVGVVHAVRRDWADGSHDFVRPRSSRRQAHTERTRQHRKWRRSPWRPGLSIVTISEHDLHLHGRYRGGCQSPDCPVAGQAVGA